MLNRISLRISTEIMKRAWNIRYGQEVYTYGIEIILSTLAEIISILISAIVLRLQRFQKVNCRHMKIFR